MEAIVAGAGLSGCTAARYLAENGVKVRVHEKKPYVGGLAADTYDSTAIMIHRYGPHAFHTNDEGVWEFLSRFTKWRKYEHRVMACTCGKIMPVPVNLDTIDAAYGKGNFTGHACRENYTVRELLESEDPKLRKVGQWAWDTFYEGYSTKQWDCDPKKLPAWIMDRVPVRFNRDGRYHTDKYQGIPQLGYTTLCENMLDHPNIRLKVKSKVTDPDSGIIFTGEIDKLYQCCHGTLPYRYLRFEFEHAKNGPIQKVAQYNHPDLYIPYTRVVEYRHMTEDDGWSGKTTLCRETPCNDGETPCYPIGGKKAEELHKQYASMADMGSVWVLGRLAEYRYCNMDQAVRRALNLADTYLRTMQ